MRSTVLVVLMSTAIPFMAAAQTAEELGSYRLVSLIGEGGMGEVWRASHQMLARPAAVKLIRSEVISSSSPAAAKVSTERFRREAEAAAVLTDAAISSRRARLRPSPCG